MSKIQKLFCFLCLSLLLILQISCNKGEKYPSCVKKIGTRKLNDVEYDIVTFGNFPQSKNPEEDGFITEPVKWRVLEKKNGKALLLAENILFGNVPFFEYFSENRVVNGTTIYPNNYEYSELRAYLNGLSYVDLKKINTRWENNGFLQTAFSLQEQKIIAVTKVDNSAKQMSPDGKSQINKAYVCANTNDKIFALSRLEIHNPAYGFCDDESRILNVTDYAYKNNAWCSDTGGGIWWLRSPFFEYASRGSVVLYTGDGEKTNRVRDTGTSIVPALWINLEK